MKIKRLNEDYLDSHEFRIQRYEDDIPELFHKVHDGYMSGMVNAKAYADALHKIYDALIELDYETDDMDESIFKKPHRFLIGDKIILDNGNKATVRANQMQRDKELIVTDDVTNKPYFIPVETAKLCKEDLEENNNDKFEVGCLVTHVDDNPPTRGIIVKRSGDMATVQVGDKDDYVEVPVNKLQLDEAFDSAIDLEQVEWKVSALLDIDALGEENWIEFHCGDSHGYLGSNERGCSFEAIGEDKEIKGALKTNRGAIDVVVRNGSEARCNSVEEIARFIAGEFGISI